jgi:hypothetical protein
MVGVRRLRDALSHFRLRADEVRSKVALRRPTWPAILTFAVVGGAVLFVFLQLSPSLLFARTTPAGGDMGAHVWAPAYLRDHLLPHGRLTGWTPDWYDGFPVFVFYFPLPSLLIVLINLVLPYGIAFKLVSVLGVLSLPVAAWAFGKLAGMRNPAPACLAVATVPFLFDRSFTIYGGNIPSTLAGEFAFSISLSVALVFLGMFARGLRTGRGRGLTAVLLAITALGHIIPTFFAVFGAGVLTLISFVQRPFTWARLRFAIPALLVGGLLAGFWVVPFLLRLPYTNDMGWEKIVTYRHTLFPANLRWLFVMAGMGGAISLLLQRRMGIFLTVMGVTSGIAFVWAPQSRLWNARLLPFWFLCLYLLAGLLVSELGLGIATFLTTARQPVTSALVATPVIALAVALVFVGMPLRSLPGGGVRADGRYHWPVHSRYNFSTADSSFIPGWAKWNYTGYERKASYPEYRDVIATMSDVGKKVGCGRAMWEYEKEEDRFGTPMALMLLPYWTRGCVGSMEGLFFESAASTPYHFLNQSELSLAPSSAQRDLPYRPLDVAKGVEHLQLLGVRYYMAISPEAQAQAAAVPALRLVASSGPWSVNYTENGGQVTKPRTWKVYEVAGSALVAPLTEQPVVVTGLKKGARPWLKAAVDFYQDKNQWPVMRAATGLPTWARVPVSSTTPPHTATQPAHVSHISTGDDRISFDVDRPGVPVVVRASYFPNWKVSGAKGVFRVMPNLMVVVPTSTHVTLHYGYTPVDVLAYVLTLLGVAAVVLLARSPPVTYPESPLPPVDSDHTDAPPPDEEDAWELVPAYSDPPPP